LGRFEILHQIGAGVLGPVFLARDPERARSVAVKVFRLDIAPEQAAELASQLARLAQVTLAHPSIVVPFDAGIEGTLAYLVEDYVAADSLDAAIRQYGPAPISQAMRILVSAAGALDFAAVVGVHHGALHPRDLLVTPDETRMTGLGVGRALEAIGLRAPMRRPYVAPERVQRERWDARADVYSLGVLARELLVGRSRPGRETAAGPRLPDDQAARLQPVFARATAARAADRFSTSLDFTGAVQDALAGTRTRATAVPAAAAAEDSRPPHAEKAGPPVHHLLLPLEPEGTDEDAAAGGAVRLRLDDEEALPELPLPADVAAAGGVTALSDFDLDTRAGDREEPADALDLSDLDSQLTPDLRPFREDEPADEDEQRTETRTPTPTPSSKDEEAERFVDVFEAEPEPAEAEPGRLAEPRAPAKQGHTLFASDAFEPAVAQVPAALHRPELMRDRRRSRALPLAAMLIVGIVLGAIAGYLIGVGRSGNQARLAPTTTASPTATPPGAAPGPAAAPQAPATPTAASGTAAGVSTPAVQGPQSSAPSATTPAAANGVLLVRSTPRGAAVTVNGRPRGVTPLRLRNLAPGRYTVRVSRRGYASGEREVVLSAERPSSTVTVSLDRASRAQPASRTSFYGSLSVDSLPAGASVFLDGGLIGTTPMVASRVAAGSHVVRVDRTGFRSWTSPIQVVSGQRLRVTASLERESK
jgi:serine/threonine protein kinase